MGVAELPEECLFKDILRLITQLRGPPPAPACPGDGVRCDKRRGQRGALITEKRRVQAIPGGRSDGLLQTGGRNRTSLRPNLQGRKIRAVCVKFSKLVMVRG